MINKILIKVFVPLYASNKYLIFSIIKQYGGRSLGLLKHFALKNICQQLVAKLFSGGTLVNSKQSFQNNEYIKFHFDMLKDMIYPKVF